MNLGIIEPGIVFPENFDDLRTAELRRYRRTFGKHGSLLGAGDMNPVRIVMGACLSGRHAETLVTEEGDVDFQRPC